MPRKMFSSGVVHKLPLDLRKKLLSNPKSLEIWESITPLARNEWICWIMGVKKEETRKRHVERTVEDLLKGKRRPCCWAGCPHRKEKSRN